MAWSKRGLSTLREESVTEELRQTYRQALKNMDARSILDHYGAENVREQNGELIHSCLLDRVIPHHSNGDKNPSASINTETLQYVCYSLSGGSIWWFLEQMEKGSVPKIQAVVSSCLNGDSSKKTSLVGDIRGILEKPDESLERPSFHPIVLRPWLKFHPYLASREISQSVAKRYSLGYDSDTRRLVFPHFWKGTLIGWQTRAQDDARWPTSAPGSKYVNSPDFDKSGTLYNYDTVVERKVESIIVVESVMSVLKAETLFEKGGEDARPFGAVLATFGSLTTEDQARYLSQWPEVVIWPDRDKAGLKGAKTLYKRLSKVCRVSVVFPTDKRDLGDLGLSEALQQYDERKRGFLAKARLEREEWL